MNTMRTVLVMGLMGLLMFATACGGGKPEAKLAKHLDAIADIMEENKESPEEGVKKLESYIQSNGPEIAEETGKLVVEFDKMMAEGKDPKEDEGSKERVEEITTALEKPFKRLMEVAPAFQEAFEKDDAAKAYIEKNVAGRFEVLKDILPGGGGS